MEASMKFAYRTLPFLLVAMFFAVPGFAQTGMIEGKVLDNAGQPMVGVAVVADRLDITAKFEVKTDARGNYLTRVPVGRYKISVLRDGTVLDFINNVNVTSGEPTKSDFDMRDLANRARAGEANLSPEERAKLDAERAKADAVKGAFDLGVAALAAKNFEEAVKQFQTAADADPTRDIVFANLGDAFSGARKYEEAANAYKKAIELKPTTAAYYNNLGIIYGNAGKMDEASAALQKVAELDPAGAGQAYYNLGAMLTNRGRTKDAATAFQKAIEFDANNADAYYQLGISHMGTPATMGDAVKAFEKYLQLQPSGPNAETAKALIEAAKASGPTGFSR
jgi:tetratricopeptide (TPR) repeat protein